MDNRLIIYPFENGISVLNPTGDIPFEEVCRKDVPAGAPYLVVTADAIPSGSLFREAWEADFSNPNGYGIGADAWFAEQAAAQASQVIDATAEEAAE